MTIQINQAPEIVRRHIDSHRMSRSCGTFFSYACCIPTLGLSICCGTSSGNEYSDCCFPRALGYKADITLEELEGNLNKLIESNPRNLKNKDEFLEWQIDNTINLLDLAIKDGDIVYGYKTALSNSLEEIKAKVKKDKLFSVWRNNDPRKPLLEDKESEQKEYLALPPRYSL